MPKKKNAPDRPQPAWLFPPDDQNPVLNPKIKTKEQEQKEIDARLEAINFLEHKSVTTPVKTAPPSELLQLVGAFLASYGFISTGRVFTLERNAKKKLAGWEDEVGKKFSKGMPDLEKIYKDWRADWAAESDEDATSSSGSEEDTSDEVEEAASVKSISEGSGFSSNASDSSDDSSKEKTKAKEKQGQKQKQEPKQELQTNQVSDKAKPATKPTTKPETKRKSPSPSSSSDASTSDSDDNNDDNEKAVAETEDIAAKVAVDDTIEHSQSSSSSASESETSSGSGYSDSGSESDSEASKTGKPKSKVKAPKSSGVAIPPPASIAVAAKTKLKPTKKVEQVVPTTGQKDGSDSSVTLKAAESPQKFSPSEASSSSDTSTSSSASDSDSDSESDAAPQAPTPVSKPTKALPKEETKPSKSQKRKASAHLDETPSVTEIVAVKKTKVTNAPFQRIPSDTKVNTKHASNAYIPYDYAERAHADLSVTKGKGFTKEKNKKKRGS